MKLQAKKKKLQKIFNSWIRLHKSDSEGYSNCISCGRQIKNHENMDAGHYIPMGKSEHLRFEPDNVWPQCISCNRFGGGDVTISYRESLCDILGEDRVLELEEQRHKIKKWTQQELDQMIKEYSE